MLRNFLFGTHRGLPYQEGWSGRLCPLNLKLIVAQTWSKEKRYLTITSWAYRTKDMKTLTKLESARQALFDSLSLPTNSLPMKFLEKPGHVDSQLPHGVDPFLVFLHFSRLQAIGKVPVDGARDNHLPDEEKVVH